MLYGLSYIKFRVREGFLLTEVVVESITDAVERGIEHRLTVKHPFLLRDVICSVLTSCLEHACEKSAVYGLKLCR